MTYEEAGYIIGNIPVPTDNKSYSIEDYQEAKTLAIAALWDKSDSVKQGEWLVRDSMKGGYTYLTCECGKRHTIRKPESTPVYTCSVCGFGDYVSIQPYKYCPNCGAKLL